MMLLRFHPRISSMWKKTILGNWQIKSGAFIVAISLWLHVVTERTYEETVEVPVFVEPPPEGWVLANPIPETARVTIRGVGKTLFRSGRRERKVVLTPSYRGQITDTYTLSPSDIDISQEIQLVEIVDPKVLELEFDRPLKRTLEVKSRIVFRPASGYTQVGAVSSEPEHVTVFGPRQYVRKLAAVYTDSSVRSNLSAPFSESVPLLLPEGVNISVTPEVVIVSLDVQEIGEHWVRDIKVGLTHVPRSKSAYVEPSRIALRVKGGIEVVKLLKPEDFIVSVDYRAGRDALVPKISKPPEIEVVERKPRSFSIVVR